MSMPVHPAAELFPPLDAQRLAELAESIRQHGLRLPIVVYQGAVLDGRNRLLACAMAGVEPRTVEWDCVGSPYDFAWATNGQRRDLEAGQRTAIRLKVLEADEAWHQQEQERHDAANAARSDATKAQTRSADGRRLAAGTDGSGPSSPDKRPDPDHAHVKLAKEAGTSPATAARVIKLFKTAPELFDKVASGETTLGKATREIKRQGGTAGTSKRTPGEVVERAVLRLPVEDQRRLRDDINARLVDMPTPVEGDGKVETKTPAAATATTEPASEGPNSTAAACDSTTDDDEVASPGDDSAVGDDGAPDGVPSIDDAYNRVLVQLHALPDPVGVAEAVSLLCATPREALGKIGQFLVALAADADEDVEERCAMLRADAQRVELERATDAPTPASPPRARLADGQPTSAITHEENR